MKYRIYMYVFIAKNNATFLLKTFNHLGWCRQVLRMLEQEKKQAKNCQSYRRSSKTRRAKVQEHCEYSTTAEYLFHLQEDQVRQCLLRRLTGQHSASHLLMSPLTSLPSEYKNIRIYLYLVHSKQKEPKSQMAFGRITTFCFQTQKKKLT